ncbi:MAG: sirohydrochlorin cobaltochelatase [Synergistaceae bacterium]|nr:sirohydrochlorin cobaltochelatase [Synergistaceae bacterium]
MKLKKYTRALILAWVAVLMASFACEALPTREPVTNAKEAILIVAFGTSVPEGEEAISAVTEAVKAANPGVEVRASYTSRIIMRKLAREQNKIIDEPAVALSRLAFEGYTDVAVLSTHMIPGAEYDDLKAVVDGFRMIGENAPKAGFRSIALSDPLMAAPGDFERMADAITATYEKEGKGEAVVLVGHGTHHFADSAYSALQMALWRKNPNFFIGTIEGIPAYDDVYPRLKASGARRVTLAPLMLVAGDHAHNDIAGSDEDSWKSMLESKGLKVTPILSGLGQNKYVQNLILDKLREARSSLTR